MFKIKQLLHVSLLVPDLAAARSFYEGVLGLAPSPKRPAMPYDGVWYELDAQQIHLLCLPSPDTGVIRPEHGGRDRHTAFAVEHLDGLMMALDLARVPYTLSRSGRRALFCRDPAGNALEFIALESP